MSISNLFEAGNPFHLFAESIVTSNELVGEGDVFSGNQTFRMTSSDTSAFLQVPDSNANGVQFTPWYAGGPSYLTVNRNGIMLQTDGGTPSYLNFYSERVVSFDFTGAFIETIDLTFTRLNNIVSISFPFTVKSPVANLSIYAVFGSIPLDFRPNTTQDVVMMVVADLYITPGHASISFNGSLTISLCPGLTVDHSSSFPTTGSCGFTSQVISYHL